MLITGARLATSASDFIDQNVQIHRGRISLCPTRPVKVKRVLHLDGYIILPGLINAHDHLDLNLFPRLGRGPYRNATEWAKDIYRPQDSPVREHIAVPKSIRLQWGALKNLISGVTTVAHHNPPAPRMFHSSFPIRVVQRYEWAHSVAFSPDWRERHRQTPPGVPFMIHAGEGTDEESAKEIDLLHRSAALDSRTVLVHGVAINERHLELIRSSRTSLVWCPSSNVFTLGCTVRVSVLQADIPIALGSDSALTACGDLLDEVRFARSWMSAEEIYSMVTSTAARVLKLPAGFGGIAKDGPADLVVFRDAGHSPAECLMHCYPEMVLVKGRVVLVSRRLAETLAGIDLPSYPLNIAERGRYLVRSPVDRLIGATVRHLGDDFQIAGKSIEQ